jgi:predicted ferric reductase
MPSDLRNDRRCGEGIGVQPIIETMAWLNERLSPVELEVWYSADNYYPKARL